LKYTTKKARLLDTQLLYIFKLSVIVYNVDVGNNGTGTDKLRAVLMFFERNVINISMLLLLPV
jgi:hypothetical protein